MSKTILYLAILAILGFGVWLFLFSDKSGELFRSADSAFTIRDTAAVGKIFLSANQSGASIVIERKEEGWIVNNKYPVLQSSLRSLLTTLANQQAMHPATDDSREGIIRSLAGVGIKVEVYDREGNRMRSFYVGGELAKFSGTAMLMEGSERPYVVQIPGFEGYLTTRYTPQLNMWRDRVVFDIAPEKITQVGIRYPLEPLNSFTLTQQGGRIQVRLDSSVKLGTPLNETRARSYLAFFSKVYAEAFLTNIPGLDSIVGSVPQKAILNVQGAGGYNQTATVLYYPMNERSRNYDEQPKTFEDRFDNDRYLALLNDGADTVSVPISFFEKIFRRGYEFYVPDTRGNEIPATPGLPNNLSVQPK